MSNRHYSVSKLFKCAWCLENYADLIFCNLEKLKPRFIVFGALYIQKFLAYKRVHNSYLTSSLVYRGRGMTRLHTSTSCTRSDTICPRLLPPVGTPAPHAPPCRLNVAVVAHAQYVLTITAAPASRVKAALSKAAHGDLDL